MISPPRPLLVSVLLVFTMVLSACSSTGSHGPHNPPNAALAEGQSRIYFTRTNQLSGQWQPQAQYDQETRVSKRNAGLAAMVLVAATIATGGHVSASIGLNTVYEPRTQAQFGEFLVDVFAADDGLAPLFALSNGNHSYYLDTDQDTLTFAIDTYSSGLFTRRYDGSMAHQTIVLEEGFRYVLLASRHPSEKTNDPHWDLQPIKMVDKDADFCEPLTTTKISRQQLNRKIESYSHRFYDQNGDPEQAYLFAVACEAIASAGPSPGPSSSKALDKRFEKHNQHLSEQFNTIKAQSIPGRPEIVLQSDE